MKTINMNRGKYYFTFGHVFCMLTVGYFLLFFDSNLEANCGKASIKQKFVAKLL